MDTLTASHICTSENQVSTNARCGHATAAFSGTAKHTCEEDDVGVLLLISPDPRSAWRRRRRKGGGWRGGATPGRPTPRLRHPKMRAEAAPSEPPSRRASVAPAIAAPTLGLLLSWRWPAAAGIGGREGRPPDSWGGMRGRPPAVSCTISVGALCEKLRGGVGAGRRRNRRETTTRFFFF